MSWSVNFIGTPEKVAAAIEDYGAKQTGQCKVEFDDAKPHLVGLVKQIWNRADSPAPMIQLDASGSGCAEGRNTDPPVQVYRSLSCHVRTIHGVLL